MSTAALAEVVPALACPVCRGEVRLEGASLVCERGHRFDVARQGHVTLLAGRRVFGGDDAAQVAARESFLGRGHYDRLADAVADAVRAARGDGRGLCVDLAGGTGYYLAAVAERTGLTGLVIDASTAALKRAARVHERVAAVGADVWQRLPLRDGAADVVLSVFGPRNVGEIRRVLSPGGAFVVASPTPRHLHELIEPLGMIRVDPDKENRLAAQLSGFGSAGTQDVEYAVTMSRADVRDEVRMGPSARHVDDEALDRRLAELPEAFDVTVSVRVRTLT